MRYLAIILAMIVAFTGSAMAADCPEGSVYIYTQGREYIGSEEKPTDVAEADLMCGSEVSNATVTILDVEYTGATKQTLTKLVGGATVESYTYKTLVSGDTGFVSGTEIEVEKFEQGDTTDGVIGEMKMTGTSESDQTMTGNVKFYKESANIATFTVLDADMSESETTETMVVDFSLSAVDSNEDTHTFYGQFTFNEDFDDEDEEEGQGQEQNNAIEDEDDEYKAVKSDLYSDSAKKIKVGKVEVSESNKLIIYSLDDNKTTFTKLVSNSLIPQQ